MSLSYEHDVRLGPVLAAAEAALWAALASAFPECETGDVDPYTAIELTEAIQNAAVSWLEANLPAGELEEEEVLS